MRNLNRLARGAARATPGPWLPALLLVGGIAVAALTLLPASSFGYVVTKSTGCAYPNNNWDVKWNAASIPVTYKINQNGTPDCADEFNQVQNGFQLWEDECRSTIDFTYGGQTALGTGSWGVNDGTNIVVWAEANWDNITNNGNDNSNVIAINYYWYACADGHLLDSDIIMNGEDYTWSCSGEANKMDVFNVAAHESGHSLSLYDLYGAGDTEKTMYGIIANGETKKQTLDQDDRDGVAYLYPSNANERVWIKDANDDYGCQPYAGPVWWNSPDVSLNPDPPVLGQQCTITVKARSMWPSNVQGTVTVEVHDPSVSLSPGVSVLWTSTQNNVTIAPGSSNVTFNWTPNANSFGEGHYCLIAIVKAGNDNTQTGVPQDNNVTCHNFHITSVASGQGGAEDMKTKAGNNSGQAITGRFYVDRTGLPAGWDAFVYTWNGQLYIEGTPIYFPPYTETFFRLEILHPASAPPGEQGTIDFVGVVDPPPPDRPPLMGGVFFRVQVFDPSSSPDDRPILPALLSKAFPNPFGPETRLALQIPREGRVTVTVFDASHRAVRTLLDASVGAGHREVIWDGRDGRGRLVPSGVYFYQVRLDGQKGGGRLLLVR
jgi:hypothetical protein